MALNTVEIERNRYFDGVEVLFDLDTLTLVGRYQDELSAFRAKKAWLKTLQDCFLLDSDTDITIKITKGSEPQQFLLSCEFISSCARYAFWRLTNNHVPEAAYLLEVAHMPESKYESYIAAPDMRAVVDHEMAKFELQVEDQKSLFQKLGALTKTFVKSL